MTLGLCCLTAVRQLPAGYLHFFGGEEVGEQRTDIDVIGFQHKVILPKTKKPFASTTLTSTTNRGHLSSLLTKTVETDGLVEEQRVIHAFCFSVTSTISWFTEVWRPKLSRGSFANGTWPRFCAPMATLSQGFSTKNRPIPDEAYPLGTSRHAAQSELLRPHTLIVNHAVPCVRHGQPRRISNRAAKEP